MLSQESGNEYNTNIIRKIVLWIVDIVMKYGIDVEIIPEEYTSQRCSICDARHENGRIYRGLYMCNKDREEDKRRHRCSIRHSS
ncbi:MAG: zinc ribbon domain-containing protein [Desulfurococcales archaeon]|jgi:putative transposase|nr:zinc ribbon domain-containing protein [Desulfurococcales archaeon]